MPCNQCSDEARCDRNGLCQTFRQELDQPTHRCSGCDTYYYAVDVPVACDNCSGVPSPVGVKGTFCNRCGRERVEGQCSADKGTGAAENCPFGVDSGDGRKA